MTITSVWSAFGHRFISNSDDTDSCLTCGAMYVLVADSPDGSHGAYMAMNGDEPMWCSYDTEMSHGYPSERVCEACADGTCVHCAHDCNCVLCV